MAKNELRFSNKTMDVIAEECGLETANYLLASGDFNHYESGENRQN